MTTSIQINLLGPVLVERDGEIIDGFKSRKILILLCYLAYQKQQHTRSRLASLFWVDKPEARGRANLSWALNNINQLLPNLLEADRETVQVVERSANNIKWTVDTFLFDNLLARGDTPALTDAVELYQGDFMEGLSLDDSPEIDNWIVSNQNFWRQRIVQVLDRLVGHHMEKGDYVQGMNYATRLLGMEPWREDIHRKVMTMLAHSGQRNAALAQLDSLKRVLNEQFEIEPEAETLQLYDDIRKGKLQSGPEDLTAILEKAPPKPTDQKGPQIKSNLASIMHLPPFIGRVSELRYIDECLRDSHVRLVTITGAGGSGKTRLALQAAADYGEKTRANTFFVPLSNISSPSLIVSTILGAIGIGGIDERDAYAQLNSYLGDQKALFVLDNFEHLLDGAEVINEIIHAVPGIKFIITSLEPLNLLAEIRLTLSGLPYPNPKVAFDSKGVTGILEDSDQNAQWEWHDYSAVQLFVQSVQRGKPGFELDAQTEKYIVRICQLLEGLPLGIELAASWVRVLSLQQIIKEIEKNIIFLETKTRDVPSRHRSLRAVFDHTWMLMTEKEQVFMRHLAAFKGRFSLDAAWYVSKASPADIMTLADKSILRVTSTGHYDMHRGMRLFGVEKLSQLPEEQNKIITRLCQYYTEFVTQREAALLSHRQKEALQEIQNEIDNIQFAWQWAVENLLLSEINKSLQGIFLFAELRGWYLEAEEVFALAIDKLVRSDEELRQKDRDLRERNVLVGRLLIRQGVACGRAGLYSKAVDLLEDGLAVMRQYGVEDEIALSLSELGHIVFRYGDSIKSEALFNEALRISLSLEAENSQARALNNLGLVYEQKGEYQQALQYFQESCEIYERVGEPRGLVNVLVSLSDVALYLDNHDDAIHLAQKSLAMSQGVGDVYGEALARNSLGKAYQAQDEYRQACEYFLRSLEIMRGLGMQKGILESLINLSSTNIKMQKYAVAGDYLTEALRLSRDLNAVSLGLECILQVALLTMANEGEEDVAGEMARIVCAHPASSQYVRDRAAEVCSLLEVRADQSMANIEFTRLVGKALGVLENILAMFGAREY
jgi:predicted ATPase/DNA-binding SARP family transcriptional activator